MSTPSDPAQKGNSERDRRAKQQDLRATADSIRSDASRLERLEDSKTDLATDDPTLRRLSTEAAEVGNELAQKTRAEEELATDLG
jgi:hypothetical protein